MMINNRLFYDLIDEVINIFYQQNESFNIIDFLIYHKLDLLYCEKFDICKNNRQMKIERRMAEYSKECRQIAKLAKQNEINIIFLKGIALSHIYKENYLWRYYSDIDLLVEEKQIDKMKSLLEKMGYRYGIVKKGEIIEPTRKQILYKIMYTHEMYPMVKINNNMVLYADVNFKFSWKGNENTANIEVPFTDIKKSVNYLDNSIYLPVLDKKTNFIHLCVHFYNEAVYFALDNLYHGGEPKEFRLFRLFDIISMIFSLTSEDMIFIKTFCDKYNIEEKIKFVLKCIYLIFGEKYLANIREYFDYQSMDVDFYYSKKGKLLQWEEDLIIRVFNIEKRKKIIEKMEF